MKNNEINYFSGSDEDLKSFLKQEILHLNPDQGTLSFIIFSWIIGRALIEEYEKGKRVLEGFVEQYRGNDAFSCCTALEALLNQYCSLKLYKGKWFKGAVKDILDEIEKQRIEIFNSLSQSIKPEATICNER